MDFGERRQARIDRYKKQKTEGSQDPLKAEPSPSNPFSNPYMNHGETVGRDHNDHIARKAFAAQEGENYFERKKPKETSQTPTIADDLNTLQNLTARLAEAQEDHDRMIKANQLIRQGDTKGLIHLLGEDLAASIQKPYFMNQIGFPQHKIMDTRNQIGSLKEELEELQDRMEEQSIEYEINGTKVLENLEQNKLQIFFDVKPEEEIRTRLKENGFHWARSEGAWQRRLNDTARYAAECALKPD